MQQLPLRSKGQLLEHLKQKGFLPDAILDIGSANGTEGLYETYPSSQYLLIDALEKFRPALEQYANTMPACKYLISAVGSRPGDITIFHDPDHEHKVSFGSFCPEGWLENRIRMVSIDSLFGEYIELSSAKSCIVKIDVDGPELDVLAGSTEAFKRNTVFIIETPLLDRRNGRISEIYAFMHVNGYEVYDILEPVFRPSDNALWQVDTVFVPAGSELRAALSYS